ncbi:hypothetical protein [Alkalihalobacillus sp. 1P02AB]|uniref:hypothetical protein n=1 Tax=Alkalihalobacillus sp. 1P02AB TaxID=3132260 RepID=UPI0039A6A076
MVKTDKKQKVEKSEADKLIEGIAIALAFLIISFYLYLNPSFLTWPILTNGIGAFFGIVGLMGFLLELGKINMKFESGIKDIVAGFFVGVIVFLLIYFTDNLYVNLLVVFLSIIVIYGIISGFIKIVKSFVESNTNIFLRIPVIILNVAIFVLTILQLVEIINKN